MARGPEEVRDRGHVAELVVVADRVEPGQRVPDPRRLGTLPESRADHRARLAVRLTAGEDVVPPGDVVLMEQVREVGPGVVRPDADRVLRLSRRGGRVLERVDAARRVVFHGAARRPLGDHEQVGRQAPGGVRLEQVVLQDEVPRVRPVVRDLVPVVIAHHVGVAGPERADRDGRMPEAAARQAAAGLADEPVHPAAGQVPHRVEVLVRAAGVAVGVVVVRLEATARARVRRADRESVAVARNPVRAGIRAEVGVERAVLLHHDHDVPDLVDARVRGRVRPRLARTDEEEDTSGGEDRERERDRQPPWHALTLRRSC